MSKHGPRWEQGIAVAPPGVTYPFQWLVMAAWEEMSAARLPCGGKRGAQGVVAGG